MLANILYFILFLILIASVINLAFIKKGDTKSFIIFIVAVIITIIGCKLIATFLSPIKVVFSIGTEWKIMQWILATVALIYLIKTGELTSENIKKDFSKFKRKPVIPFKKENVETSKEDLRKHRDNIKNVDKNVEKIKDNKEPIDLNEDEYNIEEDNE